jgi:hypothetical protein
VIQSVSHGRALNALHIAKMAERRITMKYDWKKWGRAAGMRALKTMAQAGIAGIGAAAAMGQVDWPYVASATVLAGVLSMLTSVAGLPELDMPQE